MNSPEEPQSGMTPEKAERLVSSAIADFDRLLSGADLTIREEAKRAIERIVENYTLGTYTPSPPESSE